MGVARLGWGEMRLDNPFATRYPSADVWGMIREMQPGVPYGASELSDVIDAPRRTAHRYLTIFHEAGIVEKKEMTPRVVWYIPHDRSDAVRDADPEGVGPAGTESSGAGGGGVSA